MDPTEPTPSPPTSSPSSVEGAPERKKRRRKLGYYARLDVGEREGASVLVLGGDLGREEVALPAVCIKCGSHKAILRRPTKLRWTPLWARMMAFCFVGLLLMLFMTRRAELELPLCPACDARWTTGRRAFAAGAASLILALVAVRVVYFEELLAQPMAGLPILGVALLAYMVMVVMFVRPRTLQVVKIDDSCVSLKGCHRGAAEEIVEGSRAF
jgi:hypothetical protein